MVMVTLRGRGIIPAYAGSTPAGAGLRAAPGDHPRIRGEHRYDRSLKASVAGSSPHTRGALASLGFGLTGRRIIPAYAGSTRPGRCRPVRRQDHPRIRGEHAGLDGPAEWAEGSSPHTRGAQERAYLRQHV